MTISPVGFEIFFYLCILGIGIDFMISGIMVLKENSKPLEKPRLIGLLIIKIMHLPESKNNRKNLSWLMYDMKNMGKYCFIGGVLTTLSSILILLEKIFLQ